VLNGILNVYKESGYTSNDVVAKLRGILRQRRIGHAGTLDPAATGVLPVLLGSATRISEWVMDHEKEYRAILVLGVETDTQDLTGSVLRTYDGPFPCEDEIRQAVLSFAGGYEQLPPMYSAKQVNGKRLYELVREGKVVERKKVFVSIPAITVERIDLPEVTIDVRCSKGTYIRTLCHDIGKKLGPGASMKELTRTSAGGFSIDDAVTLSQIEAIASEGRISEKIVPVEELFLDCLRVRTLTAQAQKKLLNGNALTTSELSLPPAGAGDLIRMCTSEGSFLAIYRFEPGKKRYVPYRMFV
jgi:tRNA pseudouridine55 synthase